MAKMDPELLELELELEAALDLHLYAEQQESTQLSEVEQYAELETCLSSQRQVPYSSPPRALESPVARVPEMGSVRVKDSGKERRKKRRLRHEPHSIVGEGINFNNVCGGLAAPRHFCNSLLRPFLGGVCVETTSA